MRRVVAKVADWIVRLPILVLGLLLTPIILYGLKDKPTGEGPEWMIGPDSFMREFRLALYRDWLERQGTDR